MGKMVIKKLVFIKNDIYYHYKNEIFYNKIEKILNIIIIESTTILASS